MAGGGGEGTPSTAAWLAWRCRLCALPRAYWRLQLWGRIGAVGTGNCPGDGRLWEVVSDSGAVLNCRPLLRVDDLQAASEQRVLDP